MIHAASLLHDDVIDGGLVRRGAPTFWLERGVSGAILLGDLLLFKALDISCAISSERNWAHRLVQLTGEVCQAEAEQELLLRGKDANGAWFNCVRIARQKTGSLFAYIGYALSEGNQDLQPALERAGYAVGTAYQLADDVLDATGSEAASGKTLGTDEARRKVTAVSATESTAVDPVEQIEAFCSDSLGVLTPWPRVHDAWARYLELDIRPALHANLESLVKLQGSIS
jgi:octaprenyl-diphosphate synthase